VSVSHVQDWCSPVAGGLGASAEVGSDVGVAAVGRLVEMLGRVPDPRIRRNLWLDPRAAEMPFGTFALEWFEAVSPRLEPGTVAKYRLVLHNQLLPQWEAWPLIGIFNGYIEIEKWVSELHEHYADSTVSTIFATFSTIMKAAAKARCIPASPCPGIRVTSGEYPTDKLVATPLQVLRAAMRLYRPLGLSGFVLCLMDAYTGGRWGELDGQQPHEYDSERRAITIQQPLKEVNGTLFKAGRRVEEPDAPSSDAHLVILESTATARTSAPRTGARTGSRTTGRPKTKKGRTKTPAGTRPVELPPSIALFYELLLDRHPGPFVMCTTEGRPWRRSNFRQRFWRPAWDGTDPDNPYSPVHTPPILPWFTFNEGRHTHATWLAEDGIPEVARRARLGQKVKGMARVYDHVTPVMRQQVLDALEARWLGSVASLTARERAELVAWFPHLRTVLVEMGIAPVREAISIFSPFDH
jgi:integrase